MINLIVLIMMLLLSCAPLAISIQRRSSLNVFASYCLAAFIILGAVFGLVSLAQIVPSLNEYLQYAYPLYCLICPFWLLYLWMTRPKSKGVSSSQERGDA